ncbi:MAG: hypothetical protein H8E35_02310 [Ardenticatenia bacterium]|nr:hypothetical protein [Ardenticatenia bacterium]
MLAAGGNGKSAPQGTAIGGHPLTNDVQVSAIAAGIPLVDQQVLIGG